VPGNRMLRVTMGDSRTIGTGIRWTIVVLCVALADVLLK
jgi:hypothetical protein